MTILMTSGSAYTAVLVSPTLSTDLNIGDKNHVHISDTTGAQRGGGLILIGMEIIYYELFDPSDPGMLYDLHRGMNGTAEANHVATAPVTIYSYELGIASMQAHILNLESRVQSLGG